MKKIIIILMFGCITAFLSACTNEKTISGTEIVKETDASQITEKDTFMVNDHIFSLQPYQNTALLFNDNAYLSLNNAIYKVDSNFHIEEILKCKDAVGRLRNEYLYWAVWEENNILRIIRIDEKDNISEVGKLEADVPPIAIDFYGEILYIRYKLGNVEGYHLNPNGEIAGSATADELQLYEDDNLAAEIRKENPNDSRSLYQYPYHIIGAGYSKEICGKEFLTRHLQDGEVGKEELLLRSNGQDEVLLTYYEDVVILGKQIIYFDSVDKNKLSVYDIDTEESLIFYEFKDGTFEFTAVEDNIVYGIWNSIKQSKSYFVGIDMGTFKMTSYFATDKGVDYLLLNKTIYYVNLSSGEIFVRPLDSSK